MRQKGFKKYRYWHYNRIDTQFCWCNFYYRYDTKKNLIQIVLQYCNSILSKRLKRALLRGPTVTILLFNPLPCRRETETKVWILLRLDRSISVPMLVSILFGSILAPLPKTINLRTNGGFAREYFLFGPAIGTVERVKQKHEHDYTNKGINKINLFNSFFFLL